MIRWFMLALLVAGIVTAFVTHSPGVLGIGLVLALIGAFGTVFSVASERISARARPESSMLQPDVIAAMREHAKARATGHRAPPAADPDDRPHA